MPALPVLRIGEGWDTHQLVAGRPLVLGGVTVPHTHGLLGHSDADALAHAITDALLGAAALGDIGKLFPDTSEQFKGADSMVLLAEVLGVDAGRVNVKAKTAEKMGPVGEGRAIEARAVCLLSAA
ncbi:MAG: 2-C-methyl-D-erythritol 2,4-cyclodiphosphate synthase [Rubrivivax sp.]|nr:MAG: 2-C-methyl-D-erythritol 2,4-cyclodiphosphate synthase [Rubrivivax sp.]